MKKEEKEVGVCPKCGSVSLKNSLLLDARELAIVPAGFPMDVNFFLCDNCSYYGACAKIKRGHLSEFRKKLSEVHKRTGNSKGKSVFFYGAGFRSKQKVLSIIGIVLLAATWVGFLTSTIWVALVSSFIFALGSFVVLYLIYKEG